MPHQQFIWDLALEIEPRTGLFAYSEVTVVGPRQGTGKTELIFPVMIHRCTGVGHQLVEYARREFGLDVPEPGPQRVLFTAQTADDARIRWRDTHVKRIRTSPLATLWAGPPRLTQNKELMTWVNGSTWVPGSTTGKTGGTGDTLDLGVIDEAWSRTDNSTQLAMRPAMLTRPWSQLWELSMVPGPARVPEGTTAWPYLHGKMLTGRQRVKADTRRGRAYIEFGAAEGSDPADPDTWWQAMPGLGISVPFSRIQEDFDESCQTVGGLADFTAEYLSMIPTGAALQWQVITAPTWGGLLLPPGDREYLDPVAIGVDGSPELTTASLSMAAKRDDGDYHVELIDRRAGVNWVQEAILTMCRKHAVCAVGIDRNGPLAGLVRPLTRAAIEDNLDITIVELNSAEVSAACSAFYNLTGEQDEDAELEDLPTLLRLHHIGQAELDQSVGGALKHFHGDRWRWDRVNSTADTGPIFSCTLAVAAGESEEWIGGAYDARESLG